MGEDRVVRRFSVLFAVATVQAIVFASAAAGTARVTFSNAQLTVRVDSVSGSDGNHTMFIEPFVSDDLDRSGFRVGEFGTDNPAYTSTDSDCIDETFSNEVTCSFGRNSVSMTMGDGNDTIRLHGTPRNGDFTCAQGELGAPRLSTIRLGGGNDVLTPLGQATAVEEDCPDGPPFPEWNFRLDVDGGGGADAIVGSVFDDILRGGTGNDLINGLAGADQIADGPTNDTLRGGDGNDTFLAGTGADSYSGQAGFDHVSYAQTLETNRAAIVVTVGTGANDGASGEGDNIIDAEKITGTAGNDVMTGDGTANAFSAAGGHDLLRGGSQNDRLLGQAGNDRLEGGEGNDFLFGGTENDDIEGGAGIDTLTGETGNDVLSARDGERDGITCGDGVDQLQSDLRDPLPEDCETIDEGAVDDVDGGHAVGRDLRIANGISTVTVSCPATARVACRGMLSIRAVDSPDAILAEGPYDVAMGSREAVRVRVRDRGVESGPVIVRTVEEGISEKGPRSALRRFDATNAASPLRIVIPLAVGAALVILLIGFLATWRPRRATPG
jgi:Ca2+-binding RTX toxin-like protein